MFKRLVSGIMLTLLLASLCILAPNIQPTKASGTIYINADGSIEPPTAPISNVDNIIYTFTDNINDNIMVKRSNIIVNGSGHTLQGSDIGAGFNLTNISNVTIQHVNINGFQWGIHCKSSSNNSIIGNNITACGFGLFLSGCSTFRIEGNNIMNNGDNIQLDGDDNFIERNKITASENYGIGFYSCRRNHIRYNEIANNPNAGIWSWGFLNNTFSGNNITANGYGIRLIGTLAKGWVKAFHNSFIDNTQQVFIEYASGLASYWDNGYPSGGNFWSDYSGSDLDNDGIGDSPYSVTPSNKDNYPLIMPWSPRDIAITAVSKIKTIVCQGFSLGINVTALNEGNKIEAFNVTAYANLTSITTQSSTLANQSSGMLSFSMNTSGLAKGNYTIRGYAVPIEGEVHTSDNLLSDGWIIVSMVGDITSEATGYPDGRCDMSDVYVLATRFGAIYPNPKYVANYDIDNDGRIDMGDIYIVCRNFGKIDP